MGQPKAVEITRHQTSLRSRFLKLSPHQRQIHVIRREWQALPHDEAYLYRTLATLRDDVPLQETLDDLKWQGADARLKKLCHELGDDRIPERILRWR